MTKSHQLCTIFLVIFLCSEASARWSVLFKNTGDEAVSVTCLKDSKLANPHNIWHAWGWVKIEPGETKVVVNNANVLRGIFAFSKRGGYVKYNIKSPSGGKIPVKFWYVDPDKGFGYHFKDGDLPHEDGFKKSETGYSYQYVKIEPSFGYRYQYGGNDIRSTVEVASLKTDIVIPFEKPSFLEPVSDELHQNVIVDFKKDELRIGKKSTSFPIKADSFPKETWKDHGIYHTTEKGNSLFTVRFSNNFGSYYSKYAFDVILPDIKINRLYEVNKKQLENIGFVLGERNIKMYNFTKTYNTTAGLKAKVTLVGSSNRIEMINIEIPIKEHQKDTAPKLSVESYAKAKEKEDALMKVRYKNDPKAIKEYYFEKISEHYKGYENLNDAKKAITRMYPEGTSHYQIIKGAEREVLRQYFTIDRVIGEWKLRVNTTTNGIPIVLKKDGRLFQKVHKESGLQNLKVVEIVYNTDTGLLGTWDYKNGNLIINHQKLGKFTFHNPKYYRGSQNLGKTGTVLADWWVFPCKEPRGAIYLTSEYRPIP